MRYQIVLFFFLKLPALAQRSAPESAKVRAYLALSQASAQKQPDSAVHYANEGIKLAEQENDREGLAALLVQLGHINALHHTELARSFYNEALGMYRRRHDAAGIAHTYDQLGLLDGDPRNFNQALKYDRGIIQNFQT